MSVIFNNMVGKTSGYSGVENSGNPGFSGYSGYSGVFTKLPYLEYATEETIVTQYNTLRQYLINAGIIQ